MVTRDRLVLAARELDGIDGLLDIDHDRAGLAVGEPDQDLVAFRQRLVMQPENARAQPAGVARAFADMGDDVAALDEQLAVERDADRAARAVDAVDGRHRPALARFDLGDLAGRHDHHLLAGSGPAGPTGQPMRGVCEATPSPSRAEIGMMAAGLTPRPIRCAEISSLISLKRSAEKSTRSILLTTTATCLIPSRCSR